MTPPGSDEAREQAPPRQPFVRHVRDSNARQRTRRDHARRLEEPELAAALTVVGLALDAFLTDDHAWLRAVPSLRE